MTTIPKTEEGYTDYITLNYDILTTIITRVIKEYNEDVKNLQTAIHFTEKNKANLLNQYNGKAQLSILENYYSDDSIYWQYEKYEGRKVLPIIMRQRQAFINTHIIKFFQGKKIRYLSQITPLHIRELKNHLKLKGLTPQTINYNLNSFKKCLLLFKDMGEITTDFSNVSFTIKGSKEAEKTRSIYPINTLKGIFNRRWENKLSRLLCMLIYFTGIRNSELLRVQLNDIERINNVWFLNVRGTKSKNALRKVPVHNTLYKALEEFAEEENIGRNVPIFNRVYNFIFRQASFDMGSLLGYDEKQLLEKNICFYSGRHTFKTCMAIANTEKIAELQVDFQEMFMGHPFNKDKMKDSEQTKEYTYKHLDSSSIGNDLLSKKGLEVFKVIDHYYL